MTAYQFDGVFRDNSWAELPSPDDVKTSVERAIRGATPQVFAVYVSRIDVTTFEADMPAVIPQGWPHADVVVEWEVPDDD